MTGQLPAASLRSSALNMATHITRERCRSALPVPRCLASQLRGLATAPAGAARLPHGHVRVGVDRTPTRPTSYAPPKGFAAKHMWRLLATNNTMTFGVPVRVDGVKPERTSVVGPGHPPLRPDASGRGCSMPS
jgi:hypothetical protein